MNLPHHQPLLYLITNRHAFRRRAEADESAAWQFQIEAIRLAAAAGCPLVQIREKDLPPQALVQFTRDAIIVARPYGTKVIVNDRLDVALATKADGVHLRSNSLTAPEARRAFKKCGRSDLLVGVSTHSAPEAILAQDGGADFIVCGPVYDTPSKREYGPPLGIEKFAEICGMVEIPVLALGGITMSNFQEPLCYKAAGIAAIGLFTDLDRIQTITSTIVNFRQSDFSV